jgi:lysophospholipase L1-like esterase
MKKVLLVSIAFFIIVLVFFAWYLKASIYWSLGKSNIHQPTDYAEFIVGKPSGKLLTYAAIGDSLTAGVGVASYHESYPYLIAEHLAGTSTKVHLVPFAVPGIRSQYVLDNFITPVIASKPDVITLLIGVNDMHGKVSIAQFTENYRAILTHLTTETKARVYVINMPYIGTPDLISLPYRYYFDWRTGQYNEVIKKLAAEFNVTYIDLYSAHEPHALDDQFYAADFFHPNAVGYKRWADAIYANFSH